MKRFAQHIATTLLLLMASVGSLSAADGVKATITETEAGKAWDVKILLKNTSTNYTAFQMDLSLPAGVNYVEGSLATTSRTASHSALVSTLSDGTLRLLGYSSANAAIVGVGEGVILTLKLTADPALSAGDYSITLSNVRFSMRTGVEKTFDNATATLVATSPEAVTYDLIYVVDGVEYARETLSAGATITPLAAPEKEGHTFSGWQNLPEVMPAEDVTVTGTFTVNSYVVNFYLDGNLYQSLTVQYGTTIPLPEVTPAEGYAFSGWQNVPETMPAHDLDIYGTTIDTGIKSILLNGLSLRKAADIYDLSGRLVRQQTTTLKGLPRGIYLVGKHKMAVR